MNNNKYRQHHYESGVTTLTSGMPSVYGERTLRLKEESINRHRRKDRLHHLFEDCCDIHATRVAIIMESNQVTYAELDARANQLARYLLANGVRPGDRVGIHLERSLDTYISLLAILKAHAAFVPMDTAFPPDRKLFIAEDSGLSTILTTSELAATMPGSPCRQIALDLIRAGLELYDFERLRPEELPYSDDELCYIIYTSGTSGRPKGVGIEHPSINNFVRVARETYGIQASDRVYQGMTIAFDFSIEEIWLPLTSGAAIVPCPTDNVRLGPDLAEFLNRRKITVMCCVPTLLATIDRDIPSLRLLMVGGEHCPQDIVTRWSRPGRRMLNTYGPTEATVTAMWGELMPDRPVTIGRAMPTYTIYLLGEDQRPVPQGEIGEICIAGIGLACCYINRDDLTREQFIPDTLNTPANPSGRIYRTGDLGRLRSDGEIEYLGRADMQVKIRGYRIELTEIESIILQTDKVENSVVSTYQSPGGVTEIVAYCKPRSNNGDFSSEALYKVLRQQLPGYMLPAYLETIHDLPVLDSGKVDRSKLPPPKGPRLGIVSNKFVAPKGELEEKIAGIFGHALNIERVSAEDDFFNDLGGHSMVAAKVVSLLRKEADISRVSFSDIYSQPTVRGLARHITDLNRDMARVLARKAGKPAPRKARDRDVWLSGIGQVTALYIIIGILALPVLYAIDTIDWGQPGYLVQAGLYAMGLFATLALLLFLPIPLKWLLLGRPKPGSYPLWGWFFLRWWIVNKVTYMASMSLLINFLSGTPLVNLYYRLMGARIGRGCLIETPFLYMLDLIEIGDETSIGDRTHIFGYSVSDGMLHLRRVKIGSKCFVGNNSVIMPGSEMQDGAWLGDQSLLQEGAVVPKGESWCGSPAGREDQPNPEVRELAETPKETSLAGRFVHTLGLTIAAPVLIMLLVAATLPGSAIMRAAYYNLGGYWYLLSAPAAGLAYVLTLSAMVVILKRIILPTVKPGIYPVNSVLYIRKWFVDKLMEISIRMTDSLYATLYLPPFLRMLGVKIGRRSEISTISHITPNLLSVGEESFIADNANVGPSCAYNGMFSLKQTTIGRRSFVGNAAFVPSETNVESDSLIGVLSVPPTGEIRNGSTWLGSPAINLPRRQPSKHFPESETYSPKPSLVAKRLGYEYFRATLPSTLYYLIFFSLSIPMLWMLEAASFGLVALLLPAMFFASGAALAAIVVLIKKILIGTYKPTVRPLWDVFVRRSELVTGLYENVVVPSLLTFLSGTPFAAPILRMMGVKVGRRCYMETTHITEFDLVSIGDDCSVSVLASLQSHLFEDRVMKMSYLRIGNGCSIGPRAVVLYDSVIEDNVNLDALSLLMKGETLPAGSCWRGSPSRQYD